MNDRTDRLIDLLAGLDVDLMLVTDLVNVRYLTGYTGSNGLALVGPRTRTFVTDFRYVEQAAAEVDSGFERRRAPRDLIEAVTEALPPDPVRLGFEDADMTVRQHKRLREMLPARVELVPAGTAVKGLRRIKEPREAEAIRAACRLADAALEQVLAEGLAGRTEREVALRLERTMQDLGASRAAFDSIVAAGPRGALPHARPTEAEIRAGDMVVIDWGAELDGYCSDCTRTVAVGEPGAEAREIHALVLTAQLVGLSAVKPGAAGRAVDAAARSVIAEAGHAEAFGHGLGHGVGLEVHEPPQLSTRSEDELAAGNTVTVEPGVYLPGRFGVRIEDLVLVTEAGAEVLSSLPKELV